MVLGENINRILSLKLHLFNYAKHDLTRKVSEEVEEKLPKVVIKSVGILIERRAMNDDI